MNKESQETFAAGLREAILADPEHGPRFAASEALDKEAAKVVEFVDLDIAFSPVLLFGHTEVSEAVEVAFVGEDGRGVIKEPYRVLTNEELKLARARFLVSREKSMKSAFDVFRKKT